MVRMILDWCITSSALIALVLVLRRLVGQRVSPRLRYALWLLVLVRLSTPNLPWESGASVLGAVRSSEGYQLAATLPDRLELYEDGRVSGMSGGSEDHFEWDGLDGNGENSETFHNPYGWVLTPSGEEAQALREEGEKAVDTASLKRMVDVQSALGTLWQCGIWLMGGFFLIVNLRFWWNLRKTRRPAGDYRGKPVYEADGLPSPCLFGLLRPAIYLTPGLEGDEREHVLAHEYTHFRQGDTGWAIWRGVLLALHWYNPLVWLAAHLSRRDCELSCDEGAVKLLGEEHRADYGRTLVGLVTRKTAPADLLRCATTMTGGKSALKERIALLVQHPRTTAAMAVLVAAACVLFSVCTFTGAAKEEAGDSAENLPVDAADLPDTEDLPTSPDWDAPIWLLARVPEEDIFLYQDRETGETYLRYGEHLQALETGPLYDGQGPNDIEVVYRDLDGDGTAELAATYRSQTRNRDLLVCRWDGRRWREYRPEWLAEGLAQDFRDSYTISEIHEDPGMGETPEPSIFLVNWRGSTAALDARSWPRGTGGRLDNFLQRYRYSVGAEGIMLTIEGEAIYVDAPVSDGIPLRAVFSVTCGADGDFSVSGGTLIGGVPADLPTAMMDLSRPAQEQGNWLLLAKVPESDIALYRSAWDDQHVYLRVTNQCFQAFERDLSGMELLPTLDLWDTDADLAVQVLYRRHEGTYFNGTTYEPGIVADPVGYTWSEAGACWTETSVSTRPLQRLTEDLPALADLPQRLVRPGTPEAEADMWRIGEVPEAGLSLYYQQSTGKTWLRDKNASTSLGAIQEVEGAAVYITQMILPELYWEDLDGDGTRELAVISCEGDGTGVHQETLTVFRRFGQGWTWTTHRLESLADSLNREMTYQFYEDGTAYLSWWGQDLLLDLSELWESGYWDRAPDYCGLTEFMTSYAYEDGGFVLTIGGEILDSAGPRLHGYCFEYACPITYISDYSSGEGYLSSRSGVLRSEFAAELPEFDQDTLSQPLRRAMGEFIEDCRAAFPGVGMEALSQNRFAVHDIDGDGQEELICELNAAESGTNCRTTVYNADGTIRAEFQPTPVFYSNGVVSEPWSHNQGPACAIWPYRLCQWDAALDAYEDLGGARARSDRLEGFPRAADRDGDGMVYYIGEDAYREENPVDGGAYQTWRDQHLAGAEILPVRYYRLTEDIVSLLQ